jgi:hypothetical protein
LLPEDPSEEELARNWTLSEADRREAAQCRGDENRRHFALQLCVLRRHGRLLESGEIAPVRILNHLGAHWNFRRSCLPRARCGPRRKSPAHFRRRFPGRAAFTALVVLHVSAIPSAILRSTNCCRASPERRSF